MEDNKIFIICKTGDNYSPYWNVFYNPNKKIVEWEGAAISGDLQPIEHYIYDYSALTTAEIVEELKTIL